MVSIATSEECAYMQSMYIALSADHPHRLILFRQFVSRKAAGKGRAVLEGVGLESETIAACFNSHSLSEEEAIQIGLTKWSEGQGSKSPTWKVLFTAMEYAQIAQQHIHHLKTASSSSWGEILVLQMLKKNFRKCLHRGKTLL